MRGDVPGKGFGRRLGSRRVVVVSGEGADSGNRDPGRFGGGWGVWWEGLVEGLVQSGYGFEGLGLEKENGPAGSGERISVGLVRDWEYGRSERATYS